MVDFPTSFNAIIFGTLIIGIGYIGLSLKCRLSGKDIYSINNFDKVIQSLLIGIIAFYITLQPNITSITLTEQDILGFILTHPSFFFIELFIVFMLSNFLDTFESFLNKISQRSGLS